MSFRLWLLVCVGLLSLGSLGLLLPIFSNTSSHTGVWQSYDISLAEEKRRKLDEGCQDDALEKVRPEKILEPIWPVVFGTPRMWETFGFPQAKRSSGKYYYEVVLQENSQGARDPQLGWLTDAFKPGPSHEAVGFDEHGWASDGVRNIKWWSVQYSQAAQFVQDGLWPRPWTQGDVIGLALDIDECQMKFSLNGEWNPKAEMTCPEGYLARTAAMFYIAVTIRGKMTFHIGRNSWKFAGPTEQFKPWFDAPHPISRPVDSYMFGAVEVSLPLKPPFVHADFQGYGQVKKNIVGVQYTRTSKDGCVVYGFGIANDASFELEMVQAGCETHAFDCTIDPSSPVVAGKPFKFHNWCVGSKENANFSNNKYVGRKSVQDLQFKSLSEVMRELGHKHITLLKFDIEGFEWQLFETEILPSQNLPEQLAFELHTQIAHPGYVPASVVREKGYRKVNELFRSLYDKGYRVVSKEVNSGDLGCAEFVLLHRDEPHTLSKLLR